MNSEVIPKGLAMGQMAGNVNIAAQAPRDSATSQLHRSLCVIRERLISYNVRLNAQAQRIGILPPEPPSAKQANSEPSPSNALAAIGLELDRIDHILNMQDSLVSAYEQL